MNNKIKSICIYLSIFFIVFYILFPKTFSSISFRLINPLWSIGFMLDEKYNESSTKLLKIENEELKKQNFILKEELKNTDSFKKIKISGVLADVLLRPPKIDYDNLIVNKGYVSGVKKSQKVFDKNNHYIGYVTVVWKDRSEVTLWSSPEVNIEYKVNDFVVSATSTGGGGLKLEVPKNIVVVEGDALYIEDFVVGRVVGVEHIEKSVFSNIYASLLVNPLHISKVIISDDEI